MKSRLEKRQEKTQKPLWFLGFPNRYLFRFAMLVAGAGLDAIMVRLRPAVGGNSPLDCCIFIGSRPPLLAAIKNSHLTVTVFMVAGAGLEPAASGL